jgi:acetyltransferase-like isoleucine patch superfamily enzyme
MGCGGERVKAVKSLVKWGARTVALLLVLPAALLALFGRFHGGFVFCAQALALAPGVLGSYLRVAFYSLTLGRCGEDNHISVGSYFSHAQASMGAHVGIGAYCVLGQVDLGDRTMLATGVQILSGSNQHVRDAQGRLSDEGRTFRRLKVGSDCWVGAASIIMADLGAHVTVAAGSVVSRDIPAGATVAGNPARLVRPATSDIGDAEKSLA